MLTGCALLFMLTLGGVSCEDEKARQIGGPTEPPAQEVVVGLEISSLTAAAGDSLTLAVSVPAELDQALGAVLGRLQLDTAKMQLIGEIVDDSVTIVSVNPRTLKDGYLRFLTVNPRGLSSRLVVLGFEVRGAGYEAGLSFTAEQSWDSAGKKLEPPIVASGVSLATDLPPARAARAEAEERIELTGPKATGPLYPRLYRRPGCRQVRLPSGLGHRGGERNRCRRPGAMTSIRRTSRGTRSSTGMTRWSCQTTWTGIQSRTQSGIR